MTSDQIDAHKLEQEKQLDDMRKRHIEEQIQKKQHDNMTEDIYRQMTLRERELSRNIRDMNRDVREENERLADEQKEKIEHYEKVINTNTPTDDFFSQFGTSAR